jgi:hypothetical protein
MSRTTDFLYSLLMRAFSGLILLGLATVGMAEDVPIVQA